MHAISRVRSLAWLGLALVVSTLGCADDDPSLYEPPVTSQARIDLGASITLSTNRLSLRVRETFQARLRLTLSDGSIRDVTQDASWSSADTSVAWVQKGKLVGVGPGITQVMASYAGRSASAKVMVTTEGLRAIELMPESVVLPKGSRVELSVVGVFDEDARRDITSLVRWRSSDKAVARVQDNSVLGEDVGTASIEATLGAVTGSTQLTVTDARLVDLQVFAPRSSMPMGTAMQLLAEGRFSDGEVSDVSALVEWASQDSNLASIDEHGLLSAHNSGRVSVSARLLGRVAAATISVTAAELRAIAVTPSGAALGVGARLQLHATGRFSDGSTLDVTTRAKWQARNPNLLTVSDETLSKGVARAVQPGRTSVSAALGGVSGITSVVVTAPLLVAITLSPAKISIVDGAVRQLTAMGRYTDGTTADLTGDVSWGIDDPAIATIAGAGAGDAARPGMLQSLQAGRATLTAALAGVKGTAELTVTDHVPVRLEVDDDFVLPRGASRSLTAMVTYSDGERAEVTDVVQWQSSDPQVVSVSADGRVSALEFGDAAISAQLGGASAGLAISVGDPVLEVLSLDAAAGPFVPDAMYALRATAVYSDGSLRDVTQDVVWTSSAPAIATVDEAGMLLASAPGVATIAAAFAGLDAEIRITVGAPSSTFVP